MPGYIRLFYIFSKKFEDFLFISVLLFFFASTRLLYSSSFSFSWNTYLFYYFLTIKPMIWIFFCELRIIFHDEYFLLRDFFCQSWLNKLYYYPTLEPVPNCFREFWKKKVKNQYIWKLIKIRIFINFQIYCFFSFFFRILIIFFKEVHF